MKFVTRSTYTDASRVNAPRGTETEPDYILGKDEKGVPCLIKKGERPIHKIIQESSRGISVKDVMARFVAGDTSVVADVAPSEYLDITDMPTSFLEAQDRLAKANQLFEGLPVNVRNAYSNNVNAFLAACGDGSFFKRYGIETSIIKQKAPPVNHAEKITKELKAIADKLTVKEEK